MRGLTKLLVIIRRTLWHGEISLSTSSKENAEENIIKLNINIFKQIIFISIYLFPICI